MTFWPRVLSRIFSSSGVLSPSMVRMAFLVLMRISSKSSREGGHWPPMGWEVRGPTISRILLMSIWRADAWGQCPQNPLVAALFYTECRPGVLTVGAALARRPAAVPRAPSFGALPLPRKPFPRIVIGGRRPYNPCRSDEGRPAFMAGSFVLVSRTFRSGQEDLQS